MAAHSISIQVINSTVGIPQGNNGIIMLFIKATAISNTFALNTPYLLTQLSDATALGITAANDAANNLALYQQISEFYGQAGSGALLWIYGVAAATPFATFVASSAFDTAIRFTGLANPLNQVNMIGFCYDVPQAVTQTLAPTVVGLNDLTYAGNYNQALPGVYIVEIDGVNGVKTVTLGAGGTGYAANDVLTVVHSGGSGATVKVLAVTGGVVTTFQVLTAGTGYAVAATQATTGGTGTGATFNVTVLTDTFKYNINGGSYTTGINITAGIAQSITDGVTVTFAAALGHTLNDLWTISYIAGNANNSGSSDFPADVLALLTAAQTKQQQLFAQGYYFSGLIDGYNMLWSATPETLITMATQAAFSFSMCITGTKGNGVSAVGLALGRFARISIGHGFGEVDDGPVDTTTAFLTNGIAVQPGGTLVVGDVYTPVGGAVIYNGVTYQPASATAPAQPFTAVVGFGTFTTTVTGAYVVANSTNVSSLSPTDITSLGEDQYLFLRTWQYNAGYFWNDGATATATTQELSTQETNRVANVLSGNALAFFITTMGKNLPLNPQTGLVQQSVLNTYQSSFYTQYIQPLIASGDISGGAMAITSQVAGSKITLVFTLSIVGAGIVGDVNGTVVFVATLP